MAISFDVRVDLNNEGFGALTTDPVFETDVRNRWQNNLNFGFPNRYRIGAPSILPGTGGVFYPVTDRALTAEDPERSGAYAGSVFALSLSQSKEAFSGNRQVLGQQSLVAPAIIAAIIIVSLSLATIAISGAYLFTSLSRERTKRELIDACAQGLLPPGSCDNIDDSIRETGIGEDIQRTITLVLAAVGAVAVLSVAIPFIQEQIKKQRSKSNGK